MGIVLEPRFVAIDSSLLGASALDFNAVDRGSRDRAAKWVDSLFSTGWIPVLSLHHFEELISHGDENTVEGRIRFLQSLPQLAWIGDLSDPACLGSILDVVAQEVLAISQGATSFEERLPLVRAALLGYGRPCQIDMLLQWRELRPYVRAAQLRALEIASIAHSHERAVLSTTVGDLRKMRALPTKAASKLFDDGSTLLTDELRQRGDHRIADPERVARLFFDEVRADFAKATRADGSAEAVFGFYDVPPEVADSATLAEVADIAKRRRQLRLACSKVQLDLDDVWPQVRSHGLLAHVLDDELAARRRRAPRASGGDLTDAYLAALCPFLDAVVVDKRTCEFLNQAARRSRVLRDYGGTWLKCPSYAKLPASLPTN